MVQWWFIKCVWPCIHRHSTSYSFPSVVVGCQLSVLSPNSPVQVSAAGPECVCPCRLFQPSVQPPSPAHSQLPLLGMSPEEFNCSFPAAGGSWAPQPSSRELCRFGMENSHSPSLFLCISLAQQGYVVHTLSKNLISLWARCEFLSCWIMPGMCHCIITNTAGLGCSHLLSPVPSAPQGRRLEGFVQ